MGTYYHFTSTLHLPKILADGFIKPVESNVGSPHKSMQPAGEHLGPDVVWLLDTPTLEFDHGLGGSTLDKTEIMFTVDVPLAIRWLDWSYGMAMNKEWRGHFLKTAGGEEAAEHWYVVPAPVYRRRWTSVVNVKEDVVIL